MNPAMFRSEASVDISAPLSLIIKDTRRATSNKMTNEQLKLAISQMRCLTALSSSVRSSFVTFNASLRRRGLLRRALGSLAQMGVVFCLLQPSYLMAQRPGGDTPLPSLLAQRLQLMRDVAAYKWHHAHAIEDLEREKAVLDNAQLSALRFGLTSESSRAFFEAQIEAAKVIQRAWFEQWYEQGSPAIAPDLNRDLRPALLRLGDQIVQAWAEQPIVADETLEQVLTNIYGLSDAAIDNLIHGVRGRAFYPDTMSQILGAKRLRIGTTGDYAPFSLVSTDGFSGVDVSIGQSIARALGVEPVFVKTSWSTLMADYEERHFDIALSGITVTEKRALVANFSVPYYADGKAMLGRCSDGRRWSTLASIDRPEVRVIVNPGGTNQAFVDEHIRNATITVFDDNRTIFHEIAAGRADIMITDAVEIRLQTARNPSLCQLSEGLLSHHNKAVLMTRDSALNASVNATVERLLQEGRISAWLNDALAY